MTRRYRLTCAVGGHQPGGASKCPVGRPDRHQARRAEGVSLILGGRVMTRIGSANQDDTVFEDGGTLDNSRLQTRTHASGSVRITRRGARAEGANLVGGAGPAALLFCVLPMRPGSLNDENAQCLE